MRSTKSLSLMVIAGAAWLNALPAAAEEERHHENEGRRYATPDSNPASRLISVTPTSPPAQGGINAGTPTSPRAPENRGTSYSDRPSVGESILMDLLFGSPSEPATEQYSAPRSNFTPTRFSDLSSESWYVAYAGLGAGKSVAYYPSNSDSHFAWKAFFGARTRYFGVDLGFNALSAITTTVNFQQVDVTTDAFSLSLVGYLPLASNADLLLKYGGISWSVGTNTNGTGYLPVKDGTSRILGAGFEIRDSDGAFFLRLEKEFFRDVYQSKYYTFVGLSVGSYF